MRSVEDLTIPTRAGAIGARLYIPLADPASLVVYVHGGGWVLGTLDDFDTLARTLASHSGGAVLLVDYRLAPEHPFPAAHDDVEDAVIWSATGLASRLGGALPLIVAGDSAGANLAAAAAVRLRGKVDIALQVLFNPVADTDFETDSYRQFDSGYTLTGADMRWFFGLYGPASILEDPRVALMRQADLQGVAPAWIGTAEFDVLRDEGEAYARLLRDAGVAVELQRHEGMVHGYARMTNLIDVADTAVKDAASAIARAARAKSSR